MRGEPKKINVWWELIIAFITALLLTLCGKSMMAIAETSTTAYFPEQRVIEEREKTVYPWGQPIVVEKQAIMRSPSKSIVIKRTRRTLSPEEAYPPGNRMEYRKVVQDVNPRRARENNIVIAEESVVFLPAQSAKTSFVRPLILEQKSVTTKSKTNWVGDIFAFPLHVFGGLIQAIF